MECGAWLTKWFTFPAKSKLFLEMIFILLWIFIGQEAFSDPLHGLPLVRWFPSEEVVPGETVRLECQVSPSVAGPAIWLKLDPSDPNNHEVISHGQLLIRQDDRLSVILDTNSNTYSLVIKDVSSFDEGGYQCQVPIRPDEEEVQAAAPVVIHVRPLSLEGPHTSRGCSGLSTLGLLLASLAITVWGGTLAMGR